MAEPKIPQGGLRPGLWTNDITQTLSPDDAARVKEKLPFYQRSGPGLVPASVMGAILGGHSTPFLVNEVRDLLGKKPLIGRKGKIIGAAAGATLTPALIYALTRSGAYDKQALKAAKKTLDMAKESEWRNGMNQVTLNAFNDELLKIAAYDMDKEAGLKLLKSLVQRAGGWSPAMAEAAGKAGTKVLKPGGPVAGLGKATMKHTPTKLRNIRQTVQTGLT